MSSSSTSKDGALSTQRIIIIGILVSLAYYIWGVLLSLQPTFYPSTAKSKGATPSQYGLVFGIANLAGFISAPIFGLLGSKIGAKYLYNFGSFIQALATLSFGFLNYLNKPGPFVGFSYLLRALDGMADAAIWGSILSILMKRFPGNISTILSTSELIFGLGYMSGPVIGSVLFSIGGFELPFWVVGGIALVIAICLMFIMPHVSSQEEEDPKKVLRLSHALKFSSIYTPILDNFVCLCGFGMIESFVAPYLKSLGADQTNVGNSFLIMGAFYVCGNLSAGAICDRISYPNVITVSGNLAMAMGFALIGSLPSYEPSLTFIITGMALIGLGNSFIMVATFSTAHKAAISHGYKDDMDTYLFISGLWLSSFYLGNFVGPTMGGILIELLEIRRSSQNEWKYSPLKG